MLEKKENQDKIATCHWFQLLQLNANNFSLQKAYGSGTTLGVTLNSTFNVSLSAWCSLMFLNKACARRHTLSVYTGTALCSQFSKPCFFFFFFFWSLGLTLFS